MSALLALAAAATGCGGDSERPRAERASPPEPRTSPAEPRTTPPERAREPRLPRARCPAGLGGCRTATGRIVYVERVDPDGDGDAHFVLASREGITGPGISVVDVRRDLRPHPLPRPGEHLSAAGRVQVGSYGQRQIEAVAVRVAR